MEEGTRVHRKNLKLQEVLSREKGEGRKTGLEDNPFSCSKTEEMWARLWLGSRRQLLAQQRSLAMAGSRTPCSVSCLGVAHWQHSLGINAAPQLQEVEGCWSCWPSTLPQWVLLKKDLGGAFPWSTVQPCTRIKLLWRIHQGAKL